MFKKFLLTTYYLLLATFLGCGYTFRSNLPTYIKNVYVENFNNKIEFTSESPTYSSYFPGLENDILEAVEERFMLEGTLKLVDNREDADLVLTGDLVDYIRQPLRYSGEDIEEYRLSIVVNCKAKDLEQGKLLWQGRVVGDTSYFVRGVLAKTETEAVDEAVEDLARRIVEKTVVKW